MFDEKKFIRVPLEKLKGRTSTPQDEVQPPLRPLTKAEKEVALLLEVVKDEQLRRWANDLPFLTQEERDALLLREYRRRKGDGPLKYI